MSENPVYQYWQLFANSKMSPKEFAIWAIKHKYGMCLRVLEEIGSFPSSEPELKALQEIWRG